MIDLSKLANIPYRHYLISKALCKGLKVMKEEADPHQDKELVLIEGIIDREYPSYKAESADNSSAAVKMLTNFMECTDVLADGTRIYRSNPSEDIF